MNVSPVGLANVAVASANEKKTATAGTQFESLLIAQMLKTMRESGSGWLGADADSASDTAMGMAEEHLASAISAAGGFGLGKWVKSGLESPGVSGSVDVGSHPAANPKIVGKV